MLIFILIWMSLGLTTAIMISWLQVRGGEDFTLQDLVIAGFLGCLGPILMLGVIFHGISWAMSNKGSKIKLIKGRKKK